MVLSMSKRKSKKKKNKKRNSANRKKKTSKKKQKSFKKNKADLCDRCKKEGTMSSKGGGHFCWDCCLFVVDNGYDKDGKPRWREIET